MSTPRVSILIPTLQGAQDLARLLPALARQVVPGGFELVAIDSSSDDDTVARLLAAGARVEVIPRTEFRHGATRNRLAEMARGELLLYLSQDAVPEGDTFIATLAREFDTAKGLAAVTARVLPHPTDDALTARTVLDAPEAGLSPSALEVPRRGEGPAAGRPGPRFNNVASMVRAACLRAEPFPDVGFGEDLAWAERALARGWSLGFVPGAVARHAHRYSARGAFERYRTDARFQREHLDRVIRPSLWSVARGVVFELRADWRFVRRVGAPWRELARAPGLRLGQVLGQYVGSR